MAQRVDRDLDAGQVEVLLGNQVGRRDRHPRGDSDQVKGRARVAVDRGVDVGAVHVQERGQLGHHGRALVEGQVRRPDLDRVRGLVRDEQEAVPVVDQAARGRDRLLDRAVAGGQLGIGRAVDQLEVDHPGGQAEDSHEQDDPEGQESDELALTGRPLVDDSWSYHATRSRSAKRLWRRTAAGVSTAAIAVE